MSKVADTTAAVILAMNAGQVITWDEIGAQIDQQYAMASKRTGFMSYVQVHNILEANGVMVEHTADYNHRCTFPVREI